MGVSYTHFMPNFLWESYTWGKAILNDLKLSERIIANPK